MGLPLPLVPVSVALHNLRAALSIVVLDTMSRAPFCGGPGPRDHINFNFEVPNSPCRTRTTS